MYEVDWVLLVIFFTITFSFSFSYWISTMSWVQNVLMQLLSFLCPAIEPQQTLVLWLKIPFCMLDWMLGFLMFKLEVNWHIPIMKLVLVSLLILNLQLQPLYSLPSKNCLSIRAAWQVPSYLFSLTMFLLSTTVLGWQSSVLNPEVQSVGQRILLFNTPFTFPTMSLNYLSYVANLLLICLSLGSISYSFSLQMESVTLFTNAADTQSSLFPIRQEYSSCSFPPKKGSLLLIIFSNSFNTFSINVLWFWKNLYVAQMLGRQLTPFLIRLFLRSFTEEKRPQVVWGDRHSHFYQVHIREGYLHWGRAQTVTAVLPLLHLRMYCQVDIGKY